MQPIRVLNCFAGMDRNGAETLVMNMYRNIDRNAVQFDFVVHTTKKCDFDDEIYALGGRIFYVPRYKVKNHLAYKKAWRHLFQEHKEEWKIIHGHMFSTASIYLKLAQDFGLITIVHSHNTSSGSGWTALVKDIIQIPLQGNLVDHLFACSEAAGEWLYGSKNLHKVSILNNAVDANKLAYNHITRNRMRSSLGIDQNFVIGHVGRFQTQKNHSFLIDIFNKIHEINSDAILMLIGQGELEEPVKIKVNELGLEDSVKFMGLRTDVAELLQAMDVFLFPSLYEGLPVTIIEAQAAGLPCIVSDTVTEEVKITELVKFISLNQSTERWAEEVLQYRENFTRRNTCSEIVKAGYDVKATAQWLQEFYLRIG